MRKTEKILLCLAVIALVMKLFTTPGNVILITFALTLLATIYQFFGFALLNNVSFRGIFKKESYKGLSGVYIIVAILCGFVLGGGIFAILFNIQRWGGGGLLRYVMFFPLLVINVTGIILSVRKIPLGKQILLRGIPILLVDIFFILKYIFVF